MRTLLLCLVLACGSTTPPPAANPCSACTASQVCVDNQCVTPAPTLPAIGAKCVTNADCGGGARLCAPDVPGGGYCTQECATAACPSGATCVDTGTVKLCLKSCSSGADCRAEHLCLANLCYPKCTQDADCDSSNCNVTTGLCGPSRVGNTCTADADCGQAPAFCDTSAAGGYCSLPCGGNTNVTCPQGSACATVGSGAAVCLKQCGAGCRTGEYCSDAGLCTPDCTSDADCGATLKCNTGTGACVAGGPAPGQLGGACGGDTDCQTALGANAFCSSSYPGGYCSLDCTSNTSACGAGGTCVSFGANSDCLNACASRRDCRAGYACTPAGSGSVCAPACTSDASCGSGQACDTTSGLCVTASTGSTSLTTLDLGSVAVHTTTLSPLTLTVPAGAISVTFVGQAADTTARVIIYRITSPDGTLYDYGSTSSVMKVLPPTGPGAFAVLAPNSPLVPFTPGSWTIQLLASKETTASVKALVKTSTQSPLSTGSIDLNLFFVGLPSLNATTAQTDASFKSVFDQVKAIWAQIGITVGRVTYNDVSATQYSDVDESQLGALMQLSNVPNANDGALNVFFVHSISGGGLQGYIILGESMGIPGVPVRGTTGSGLAVTTADFPNGLADIADTWVHEGSHWLGLFHTTESGGTAFDPLPDTAECPASPNDANHDGILQPQECANLGADNEMFWTSVASIPHTHLTPNQQFVLLRNPAVH